MTSNKVLANQIKRLEIAKDCAQLLEKNKEVSIKFLAGSLKQAFAVSLNEITHKPLLVITPTKQDASNWLDDLKTFAADTPVAYLVEPEKHVRFEAEGLTEKQIWMIDGLSLIQKNANIIAVATPDIFYLKIPNPEDLDESRIKLSTGDSVNFEAFVMNLLINGFDKKDFVIGPGDVAVRGGIVDLFPFGWDNPLRIEFWGDQIESIREFETLSQRSIKHFDSVEFISSVFTSSQNDNKGSIFKYLNENFIILIDTTETFGINEYNIENAEIFRKVIINLLGKADIEVKSSTQPDYKQTVKNFIDDLRRQALYKRKIFITAEGSIHLERLKEMLENAFAEQDEERDSCPEDMAETYETLGSIVWLDTSPSQGFIYPMAGLCVFTEHQIFSRKKSQTTRHKGKNGGMSLRELRQLNKGDYVVYEDKGIGRFDGFETVKLGNSMQDCIRLLYADGDKLYVHLNYIHKVSKYRASEGIVPKLTKLGTKEWERKKLRAKGRLKDIVRELIKLYAERKMKKGFAYAADSLWQKEFEASFIYEDTPDQAKTTKEVKKDLEEPVPMDRLVCGDVGFGKTEIAIRAAFKVVQSGKQVAVLVPTTILAQQHYMTFTDRLNRYPVITEVISRFKSSKQQKEIIKKTEEGRIDILIGTHRLLSKDIKFKNLGLLIIDEEHRFGVSAKEKLRQMKIDVDTLTLTATPIPRTLNFSLMGARDLSIIETSPRNRLPVETEIIIWDDKIISKAIRDEIGRGGQVFFVNDKVTDLEVITGALRDMLPTIRFGIAHGQMITSELESSMEKFISRKYDVLVCTKIVESGLDIPNANTMIINKAHHFGLAELYQLRGRVGRSNTQAYCYLVIPSVKQFPRNTLRRLQAIEEFTDLGSGFQLAMRDLEIRGAGNLFGAEQSGYINEIGFELYNKVLDEAVQELRQEEFSEFFKDLPKSAPDFFTNEDLEIEADTDAFFPESYIESDTERFAYYKSLYNVKTNFELTEIKKELEDKFGKLPPEAEELFFVVKLRIAALDTGFRRISLKNGRMRAEFPPYTLEDYYNKAFPAIAEFVADLHNAKLDQQKKKLFLELQLDNRDEAVEVIWRIKQTAALVI